MIDKEKIKEKLEKKMNRSAQPHELANAHTDANLMIELILEEIDDLRSEIESLKAKNK